MPDLPTAYEGVNFDPPSSIYQSCQFIIEKPTDPVFGLGYYRERINFQIFISDISGKGTTTALERAELIREKFKKGTTLFEEDVKILILETPQIMGTLISQDRVIVPVQIKVIAEVYE